MPLMVVVAQRGGGFLVEKPRYFVDLIDIADDVSAG